ncbi:MAG: type I methionyl aminopeptidase [Planctomycetota bacterium]|nr:type I methionyl aminopeptidase [Planctomycetota bacterium]
MITIKSPREADMMRAAGAMVGKAHEAVGQVIRPGITTLDLEEEAERCIVALGGEMAFLGYQGFPGKICVSVNEEVVHGIPGKRKLKDGDIVGVDIGALHQNYYGDGASTYAVGTVSPEAEKLMQVCRKALEIAISKVGPGVRLSEISLAIQTFVEGNGFSVVEDYVGHGIGRQLHEPPQVLNYVPRMSSTPDYTLKEGMAIAIEPMVNAGKKDVRKLQDGWTVVTADGGLSAHFEDTILVTAEGHEVLTKV